MEKMIINTEKNMINMKKKIIFISLTLINVNFTAAMYEGRYWSTFLFIIEASFTKDKKYELSLHGSFKHPYVQAYTQSQITFKVFPP